MLQHQVQQTVLFSPLHSVWSSPQLPSATARLPVSHQATLASLTLFLQSHRQLPPHQQLPSSWEYLLPTGGHRERNNDEGGKNTRSSNLSLSDIEVRNSNFSWSAKCNIHTFQKLPRWFKTDHNHNQCSVPALVPRKSSWSTQGASSFHRSKLQPFTLRYWSKEL